MSRTWEAMGTSDLQNLGEVDRQIPLRGELQYVVGSVASSLVKQGVGALFFDQTCLYQVRNSFQTLARSPPGCVRNESAAQITNTASRICVPSLA